jgi:hypothetical protein
MQSTPFHLRLGLPIVLFLLGVPTNFFYTFLISLFNPIPRPRVCVTFLKKQFVYAEESLVPPNPKAGGLPLVRSPPLLIHYIFRYPLYLAELT